MAIQTRTLKNGSIRYRASVYVKGSGKRLYGSWQKRKTEALVEETSLKHSLNTNNYIEESKLSLDQATNKYFDLVASRKLSEETLYVRKNYYENHLKEPLGYRSLTSIRTFEIQELWKQKEEEGLAAGTINLLHSILNTVYQQFIKWNEIKYNPLKGVDRPRAKQNKENFWSKQEALLFLEYAKEYQAYIAFWLALNTAMRIGEVIALTWDDVDFDNNVIRINKSYKSIYRSIGGPKTKSSNREIAMSQSQMDFLKQYKENQNPKTHIVCSNEVGGYLNDHNIRRIMYIAIEKAGVKRITFHGLRHSHASYLVEKNVPIKHIQERLGHKKISTTLDIYVHTQKAHHHETAKVFDSFFD